MRERQKERGKQRENARNSMKEREKENVCEREREREFLDGDCTLHVDRQQNSPPPLQ